MSTFFILCGSIGAAVLVIQTLLSLVGVDHDASGDLDLSAGLDLLTVRAFSAGTAGFGIGGLAGLAMGLPAFFAILPGAVAGIASAAATAWLTRAMLNLEDSGSLRLHGAIGQAGRVHLSVPGSLGGAGRVQFELQGRTLEFKAVTLHGPLPTGTQVTIVGLIDSDTVEVVPTPTLEELIG